jgi:hypothetical protein
MSAANHAFPDSDEIYHPTSGSGDMIGKIRERWVAHDVGNGQVTTCDKFQHFNAAPPRPPPSSNRPVFIRPVVFS